MPVNIELEELDCDDIDAMGGYICIHPLPSYEAFGIMERFVLSLPDGSMLRRLTYALHGKKPFRHFKDVLIDYPQFRDQWFAFEKAAYREIAERWLEEHEIDAVLVDRIVPQRRSGT